MKLKHKPTRAGLMNDLDGFSYNDKIDSCEVYNDVRTFAFFLAEAQTEDLDQSCKGRSKI